MWTRARVPFPTTTPATARSAGPQTATPAPTGTRRSPHGRRGSRRSRPADATARNFAHGHHVVTGQPLAGRREHCYIPDLSSRQRHASTTCHKPGQRNHISGRLARHFPTIWDDFGHLRRPRTESPARRFHGQSLDRRGAERGRHEDHRVMMAAAGPRIRRASPTGRSLSGRDNLPHLRVQHSVRGVCCCCRLGGG